VKLLSINRVLIVAEHTPKLEEFVRVLLNQGIEVTGFGATFYRLLESIPGIQPFFTGESDNDRSIIANGNVIEDAYFKVLRQLKTGNRYDQFSYDMIIADTPITEGTLSIDDIENRTKDDEMCSRILLIRTCAIDYRHIATVIDEKDYDWVAEWLKECGDIPLQERRQLALKAFSAILKYDTDVYNIFSTLFADETRKQLTLEKSLNLRYGGNPHQEAYVAVISGEDNVLNHIGGKARETLTARRLTDFHKGVRVTMELQGQSAVYIRHGNPAWVSIVPGETDFIGLYHLLQLENVVGGILVTRCPLCSASVEIIEKMQLELFALEKQYSGQSDIQMTQSERKNVVVYDFWNPSDWEYHYLDGCFLVQERDSELKKERYRKVREEAFDDEIMKELVSAYTVAKHSSSDSVVLWSGNGTIGIGAGQMMRSDAFEIALSQAKRRGFSLKDTVFATDGAIQDASLFERILHSGVRAIVLPSATRSNATIAELIADSKIPILLSNHRHFS
jgi:phosphoribosylaminoimidazolecarboxamide formyltransferase/IMP cyclohydrolase